MEQDLLRSSFTLYFLHASYRQKLLLKERIFVELHCMFDLGTN